MPAEYQRLADRFRARKDKRWDDQMDQDSASGKLDALFQEAAEEAALGLVRAWPPSK